MRINVYSQELLLDPRSILIVSQKADNGIVYSGVRMFQYSSDRLHDTMDDDDRTAITFWLPRSQRNREALAEVFHEMGDLVLVAPPETGLDS